MSYEAQAADIAATFRARLAALRQRLRPSEIPAAVRALKQEKTAALNAIKAQRRDERCRRRATRLARPRAEPQSPL